MSTNIRTVFGSGFMLAMLLATFASFAQDAADDIGPAVDTSAIEPEELQPAVDTSDAAEQSQADAIESIEPAVTSADITRRTTGNRVMDSIELGRTEITGNQELPKVLYIVPWKKSDPGDLMGKPVNTLLDEVLAPLDREEFVRQVNYYGDLYGEEE
ncbi:MAG: hypothetical protein K0U72_16355 [Gammaproteobacteria bacterium]|nr:hypothetical protein [Gammaproteobacteria bacterium]